MASFEPTDADWDWLGGLIAGSEFGGATLAVGLLAIQLFMVLYGISVYVSTPTDRRKGRLRFVAISCVILLASAVDTLSDVWASFRVLYTGGPTGRSYTTSYNNVYVYDEDQRVRIVGNVMLFFTIAVGDALLLWRCVVLWSNRKWVVLPPFLTAVAAIVLYAVAIPPYGYTNRPRVRAIIASAALGVATNVMVTSLIILRLAMSWLSVRKSFPDKEAPTVYTHIAAILIESAAPLTFFGLCFITTTAINYLHSPSTINSAGTLLVLSAMFDWLYYAFCALSPQMIIFRVATGASWKHGENKGETGTLSHPIKFAREASETRGSIVTESNS